MEKIRLSYRTLFENSHAVMFIVDPENGDIVDANPAASAFYGWTIEEIKKKKIYDINTLNRDETYAEMVRARNCKCNHFQFKHSLADGSIRDVEVSSGPIVIKGKTYLFSIIFDITDRIRAEQSLQKREEHFRLLVESVPAAIFVQTQKRFAYLNRSALELFGAGKAEDIIGSQVFDRVHPAFHEEILKRIRQTNEENKDSPGIEEVYLKMDGTPVDVEVSAVPFIYKGEKGALVFVNDVTERKLAEENLKKSADKLNSIFNTAPSGIGVAENRIMKEVNNGLCEMTGYCREELIGQDTRIFYLNIEDYNSIGSKIFNKDIKEKPANIETRWKKKDGSIINVLIRDTLINPGIDSTIIFTAINITERRQHEEQIRLLSSIADIAPACIFVHEMDGKMLYANEKALKTFGYTRDEFMSLILPGLIAPGTKVSGPMRRQKLLEKGEAVFELDHRHKDGTFFPMHVNTRIIEWGDRKVTLSVSSDLTERKLIEEYVSRTQKLESLGVLAGGIAHDFNNLLGVIFGYLNLAMMTSSDNEVTGYLERALSGFNRAKNLTRQLLTFSKGGTPVTKTSSLVPLLKESTRFALSGSNIKSRFKIPQDLWLCDVDENQISQLIDNIIINAKQAMLSGGIITVSAKNITLNADENPSLNKGNYVKISIKDTGTGIPADILPCIFDPFFTTKQKGNGLGLATAYSIIKKHNGDIFVESEVDKGSTFHVLIPASIKQNSTDAREGREEHVGSGNILVMDDEASIRHVIREMLKAMGYNVILASDGNEALHMFREVINSNNRFDFVLLDLTIPGGMGGEKTVKELKKLDNGLAAIAMSGYSDDPVMSDPAKYGFIDKISKPFIKSDLADVLNRHSPQIGRKK